MFCEPATVGLDVHARTVVAEAADWSTGEIFSTTLVPRNELVVGWVRDLPGPVAPRGGSALTSPANPVNYSFVAGSCAGPVTHRVCRGAGIRRRPGR